MAKGTKVTSLDPIVDDDDEIEIDNDNVVDYDIASIQEMG